VEVRRRHWDHDEFETVPMCSYRRKRGIKGYNDVSKPGIICMPEWDYNQVSNQSASDTQLITPRAVYSCPLFCIDSVYRGTVFSGMCVPQPNNFALPSRKYLSGKFSNKDAKYLFSCASAAPEITRGERELWARVSGILPRIARSVYETPLVANYSGTDDLVNMLCVVPSQ
jgi:hypothetical protein